RIGVRPLSGPPPLRPLPLLRLPVSAAGGGRLRSCSRPPSVQTKSKSPWRDTLWASPSKSCQPPHSPGTLPRANQQSTGLLVPALRRRRPVRALRACKPKTSPHGGTRHRGLLLVHHRGLEPRTH